MKRFGRPRIDEATEAMLMIEPRPFLNIPGMKARDTRYMDFTLTAKPWSQSFGVASRRLPCCTIPAQCSATLRHGQGMNQLDFKGRTAIVTGGMQGIGAAIVKRLEASGAKVRVWDLNGAPEVDVADASSIKKATEDALKELGKVDVLVNNAGVAGQNVPTVDYPIEEWERVLRINLTSQFLCCRAVAPHMVKAGYGRIV